MLLRRAPRPPTGQADMTYAEHLTAMTRALVEAARHDQHTLTGPEIDVALIARRGVLDLLVTVHIDLTGIDPGAVGAQVRDLEVHPVAVLGRALVRHPRPTVSHPPSDALVLLATTPAGHAWREVARHAVLAAHHWESGAAQAVPDATVWTGIADIAAIARQLAVIDVELAEVLRHTGDRSATASVLGEAATSGLGVAARETSRLAAHGPLAATGPDRQAPSDRRPAVVIARRAADLPATQHRLREFLDDANQVRPERLPLLATALARCALVVRDQLPATDPQARALRAKLREHARLLRGATARTGSMTSIDPGDARPLRQAAEAYQGIQRHGRALAADRSLVAQYLAALGDSTKALADLASRSIASKRWLVPEVTASRTAPVWAPLRPGAAMPHPVLAVRAAAAHADTLRETTETWLLPTAPAMLRTPSAPSRPLRRPPVPLPDRRRTG